VRRARPRRRLRLAIPAIGAALAIAVATIAVVSTHGSSNGPAPTAFSVKTAQDSASKRSALPSASQSAGVAAPKVIASQATVPDVVGRTVLQAERLLGARGFLVPDDCPAAQRVTAQRPKAGAHVAHGATVIVRTQACIDFSSP
jgi:hypothetical protein